ncbi:MAG: type II toxin-antitoxin system VapC family toxin [Sphingobacteriales bacterium]|nr:MAG: type II toxin-antitoxin system VapC family toxin [Sphingobacteriales bacterium]
MDTGFILIDTSVLIDYFRKTKKDSSFFEKILLLNKPICLTVITHFEIMIGNNTRQNNFWNLLLEELPVYDYHPQLNKTAIELHSQLKKINKSIPFQDLILAATAIHYDFTLATINKKHFQHIKGLKLLTP